LGDQSHLRLFFFDRHAYLKKQTIAVFDVSQAKWTIESKRLDLLFSAKIPHELRLLIYDRNRLFAFLDKRNVLVKIFHHVIFFLLHVEVCLLLKWIADTQLVVDHESVLHILGIQGSASYEKRGSHDHRIVHTQSVSLCDKSPPVMGFDGQRFSWTQRPDQHQNLVDFHPRHGQLPTHHVDHFVQVLYADQAACTYISS
jgi:hypothetical protein